MNDNIAARVARLGYVLPKPITPAASYVAWVKVGNLLFIAGQVPKGADGKDNFVGKVGAQYAVEEGQEAARLCALNLLAQLDHAVDSDLTRVRRCVRIGGFVNATPQFDQHPSVINGASDFIVNVLGDIGKHTRVAVGVNGLPRNVAVELDAIFEID